MAKPFRDIIGKPLLPKGKPERIVPNQNGYAPKAKDERKFAALHTVDDNEDRNGNEDSHFKGVTKTYDRSTDRMGYNRGQDKTAYFAPGGVSDKDIEEDEQIDELSKKTLGSYVSNAVGDVRKRAHREMLSPSDTQHVKKNLQRMRGIGKAVNKLTKENEEQIDEISKGVLGRYVKSSSMDMAKNRAYHDMHLDKSINAPNEFEKAAHGDSATRHFTKYRNRKTGISRAVGRLTKEEDNIANIGLNGKENALPLRAIIPLLDEADVVKFPIGRNNPNWSHAHHGNAKILDFKKKKEKKETTEEETNIDEHLPSSASTKDYIDDFQDSSAPQFAGKSKEKRRQMAIAASLSRKDK